MSPTLQRALLGATLALAACADAGRAPLVVEAMAAPTAGDAAEPYLARAADGTLWMSWLERQADSSMALRVASLGTSGSWSAPQDVVHRRDLFVNWADFPSVVPLDDGRLLAQYLQKSGSGRFAYDLMLSESRDGGATWGAGTLAHEGGLAAEHGFATIMPLSGGGAGIVFLDGNASARARPAGAPEGEGHGGAMQLAYTAWKDGVITESRIIDDRTCDCCQTTMAMTTRGPVVIYRDRSHEDVRDMSVTRLVDGAWTPATSLHEDGWKIDFCPVNGPQAAAIGDTVAVAWFTAAQDTARVRIAFSTDAGVTFSSPVRADDGSPTGRVDLEMLSGDAALVSWIERLGSDSAQVRMRIVRRDGSVQPAVVVSPSSGTRSSGFPRMARDAGGVVIAYTVPGAPSRVQVARVRAGSR